MKNKFKLKYIIYAIPLAVIFFMICLKVFLVFQAGLGFDEAAYMNIAAGIGKGAPPYLNSFDHKSPFIYYSLFIFFKIFGTSIVNMHILSLIFDLILLLVIFFVSKKYYNLEVAVYAAALYSVFINFISYDTEIPMALFGLLGIFFYLLFFEKEKYCYLFVSGIFLAISVWFKQPGIFFFLAVLIHQVYLFFRRETTKRQFLKNIYFVISGAVILSLPILSYLIYKVGFHTMFFDIILFNIKFSGSTSRILQLGKFISLLLFNFGVLLSVIIYYSKSLLNEKKPRRNLLFILIIVLSLLFFAVNKEIFFNHFVQVIPIFSILTASVLSLKGNRAKKLVIILLIVFMLNFSLLTLDSTARKIRAGEFQQQGILSEELNHIIPADSSLFSDSPQYYILTNHSCNYRFCYIAPSVASVFSFDDLCTSLKNYDYLILTHRQKYLGQENIDCIASNFNLEKRFDNADEYFLEVWKKSV